MNKKIPQLNAGSMADIAFLLLVFFLLVTTIQADKGILKILPGFEENTSQVPDRNILEVTLNSSGEFLADGEFVSKEQLVELVKQFYTNGGVFAPALAANNLPERNAMEKVPVQATDSDTARATATFGEFRVMPPSSVICLTFDQSVPYGDYVEAMNLIDKVANDLREELCVTKAGTSYRELQDSDPVELQLKRAAQVVYPTCLSEFQVE